MPNYSIEVNVGMQSTKGDRMDGEHDLGFEFKAAKNGDVVISHHGKRATVLRNDKSKWFLEDMESMDFGGQQQEMARVTGNYRRGNERTAKLHPRNR